MVEVGSSAKRALEDIALTRYACYPKKKNWVTVIKKTIDFIYQYLFGQHLLLLIGK
jgi:hypothetical protein